MLACIVLICPGICNARYVDAPSTSNTGAASTTAEGMIVLLTVMINLHRHD